jgi:hypothetical protein
LLGTDTDLEKRVTKGARQSGGKDKTAGQRKPANAPGWTNGLRQLYDSVLDEPLPDSFNDLLAKLDSKS